MAGDITITSTRTNHVDFTIPYMSSAIYTLVPATRKWNQTIVTLIRPFTVELWLTIICASIFIGLAIGILEYRADNPEFKVHLCKKVTMIIWFLISTIFFHEGRIHNRNTKVVLVIWITTIFITVQIFTSSLSSWLTVNQLQPKVRKQYEKIGYQKGSCVENFAKNQSPFTIKTLPLYNMDDYKNVLDNGTVEAIYEELPYIDMFIAKYGDMYRKDGPLADESGLAFAFSRGSDLQQEFSRAIVKLIESSYVKEMKTKYFKLQIPVPTKPSDPFPESLDVKSFFLLFLFMGITTIVVVISSEISRMRSRTRISPIIFLWFLLFLPFQTKPRPLLSPTESTIVKS